MPPGRNDDQKPAPGFAAEGRPGTTARQRGASAEVVTVPDGIAARAAGARRARGPDDRAIDEEERAFASIAEIEPPHGEGSTRPRATTLDDVTALQPGVRLGPYTILEHLGAGGMGVVYAAYDPRLDRRIALKLLHTRSSHSGRAGQRLLREAQALARLSHPGVVTVHDVGVFDDGLFFMTMEFVAGSTLAAWSRQEARPWAEVLAVYLEAAAGLAAAHRAGMVHRDFKPANVMVGEDGRVRVLDFGLAAAAGTRTAQPGPGARSSDTLSSSSSNLDRRLTATGMLMGTPAYMAPEQHDGEPADARCDQFAFCASLYEGLYGERPFTGRTIFELGRRKHDGEVTPPPEETRVPAWVHAILLRGLAPRPADRWASMDALITALRDDPAARRRRIRRVLLAALGVLALTGVAAAGWLRPPAQDAAAVCQSAAGELAEIWNDTTRQTVRSAFMATGRPHAETTYRRVAAALDRYAGAWTAMRTEACEATQVRKQQPAQVLALRMRCLDRRHGQLAALLSLFTRDVDAEVLDRSVDAALGLLPIAYCGDVEALLAAVPPPEDPTLRRRVDALHARLDQADALHRAGKYHTALEAAEAARADTGDLTYAPIRARAMVAVGKLRAHTDEMTGAEAMLRQALPVAAEARDDALLARAWAALLDAITQQGRYSEAEVLQMGALTAAARTDDALARAKVMDSVGTLLVELAHLKDARAYYERALATKEQALGPDHPEVAKSLNNLAGVLDGMAAYADARTRYERALAILERALGPDHPNVAMVHNNLGQVLQNMSALEEARAHLERALTIWEQTLGPDHPSMYLALNNLGSVLLSTGEYEQARAHYERALAVLEGARGSDYPGLSTPLANLAVALMRLEDYEQARALMERALVLDQAALGPDHPDVAISLSNLAFLLMQTGHYQEARSHLERALVISEKSRGPDHPDVSAVHINLGRALGELGAYERARDHLERAVAIQEKVLGPESPRVAPALLELSHLHLRQGAPAAALPFIQRAMTLWDGTPVDPVVLAKARLALARALWESGRERGPRVRALAEQARDTFAAQGKDVERAEAEQWLSQQR